MQSRLAVAVLALVWAVLVVCCRCAPSLACGACLIDRSRPAPSFARDGKDGAAGSGLPGDRAGGQVSGRSGCNRCAAAWWSSGAGQRIGALAGSRMACHPAIDAQGARFLALLAVAHRHEITADGALRLIDASGCLLLTARRE
jgi:hypothetical protein